VSQSRGMIERLFGFDAVSRRSNLPLIHFVQEYLTGTASGTIWYRARTARAKVN